MASLRDLAQVFISAEDKSGPAFDSFKRNVREGGDAIRQFQGYLAALGVTATAGGFVLLIKQAVDYIAVLETFRKVTGASVESLSVMREVAKLSGTDFQGVIIPVLQSLSKNMLETQANTGKAKDALRALGLEVSEGGRLKNAGDFLLEIADALEKIDENARAGFAEKIVKGGSQLLPFLQDLVREGGNFVAITKEQSALADAYQTTLVKLGIASDAVTREFALGLLPVMNDLARMFLASKEKGGGLLDTIHQLREEGRLDEWARQTAIGVGYVVDVFQNAALIIKEFANSMMVAGAVIGSAANIARLTKGNPISTYFNREEIAQEVQNIKALIAADDARWATLLESGPFGFKNVERLEALFANRPEILPGRRPGGTSPQLTNPETENLRKQVEAFIDSMNAESAKIAEQTRQLLEYGKVLDEAKEAVARLQLTEGKWKEIGADSPLGRRAIEAARLADASERGKKLVEEQRKSIEDLEKDYAKLQRTADQYIQGLDDQVQLQRYEASLIGMDETARRTLIEQMRIELELRKKLKEMQDTGVSLGDKPEEMRAAAERAKAAVAQAEQIAEFKRTMETIDRTFHDSFREILVNREHDWKAFCRSLAISFKTLVADEIYKAFIKPIVVRIAAAITGAVSSTVSGLANAGGLSGISGASNLLGLGGNFFGGAQTLADFGNFFGSIGSITEAGTTFGLMDAISGFAAANPVTAALAVAGLALGGSSLFGGGKSPAQTTGLDVSGIASMQGLVSSTWTGHAANASQQFAFGLPGHAAIMTPGMSDIIADAFEAMTKLAQQLGLDASRLGAAQVPFSFANPGADQSGGAILAAFQAQIGSLTDALALELMPTLRDFARAGETATQTLARLAVEARQQQLQEIFGGMSAAVRLQDETRDLWLSELSPLTARQRLDEAYGRYVETRDLARGNDIAAMSKLGSTERAYLQEARGYYGGASPDYVAIFRDLQGETQNLVTDTLTEQSIRFAEMGLTLKDIAANTKDLDKRIADHLQAAIDAWQAAQVAAQQAAADQISAAVVDAAVDAQRAADSADSAAYIDEAPTWPNAD